MKIISRRQAFLLTSVVLLLATQSLRAQCTLTEERRKFEGAERTVVHMENDKVVVEVVPELEGRIIVYKRKGAAGSGFEWLDDCPYHFAGRWEGVPFKHTVDAKGPDKAALTVTGGGKIAVALLHQLTGADVSSPLDLTVKRTMTLEPGSTRLRVDVAITNAGDGVAPRFRYMVHAVFGNIPPMKDGRAFWFLPTTSRVEFFDEARGNREMWTTSSGAPLEHPFNRFTPGHRADKPRYEAGGWGAVLTSAGPAYIFYDPKQFEFMQYWFGGDSEWHYTFEPHTRPVELKPGDTQSCTFTLALDGADVPFNTPTISYERPTVPDTLMPGATFAMKARVTTVTPSADQAAAMFAVKDPAGKSLLEQRASGALTPFAFAELSTSLKLPDSAAHGSYTWSMNDAGGKELASGKFDVVTSEELTQRATAKLREEIETLKRQIGTRDAEQRRLEELWKDGTNLILTWNDAGTWGADGALASGASVSVVSVAVPVLGQWKATESIRLKSLSQDEAPAVPEGVDKLLSALGNDRALIRALAVGADGKSLFALLADAAKNRAEVMQLDPGKGVVRRFGHYAQQPGETDDSLGSSARSLVVTPDGSVWVGTNAWGKTSVLRINQDGSPYEEAVLGQKGAVKRFSAAGQVSGAIGLLDTPMALAVGKANDIPVVLASFRHVSKYHDTQVKEGIMLIGQAEGQRLGEIKVPAGSFAVDSAGSVWTADVAGHVACYDLHGKKKFDVTGTSAPAVADASLGEGSPLPVMLLRSSQGSPWAIGTLKRIISRINGDTLERGTGVPHEIGNIWGTLSAGGKPVLLGDQGLSVLEASTP